MKQTFLKFVLYTCLLALVGCGGSGSSNRDADGDGVADSQDAFPTNAAESVDSDGDGFGDNADAFPNDATENADVDGDGVGDNADVFPANANETADADEDGIGDNGDNCPADANANQADGDANGQGDACDPLPTTYTYEGSFEAGSAVSYTGQTARQMLISGLTNAVVSLTERAGEEVAITTELQFYIEGEGADDTPHGFTAKGGENIIPGPNYGDVSSGKNLDGKISGGNGEGGGETGRLIGDFVGWTDGMDADPLPIELADLFIARIAAEASDGVTPTISTPSNPAVSINSVTTDAHGRDYRQLLQKFLLGAVNFSQGTNDYFQTDFIATTLEQEGTKNYTAAEHDFDEAFGYFGAARDYNDYTDDEAAGKGGRDGWGNGYHDTNADGDIDVRSEFVFGHAQNCAKRDRGTSANANPTDFTKEVMDAFLAGRQILSSAAHAGVLTEAENNALQAHIVTASKVWEKCIAATVVHYINDTVADMGNYVAPDFADLDNFSDMAKHWGEMKGFALNLQFSPASPFRDGSVEGVTLDHLSQVLTLMGDAPVLADGSQGGEPTFGTAQAAIDGYVSDLLEARDILQAAYEFDPENVANW